MVHFQTIMYLTYIKKQGPGSMLNALLILGPTGSGKTPLGNYLEKEGLNGRRCVHFDFGWQLREIRRTGVPPEGCTPNDVAYIRKVLEQGALLERETFYIAENILRIFVTVKKIQPQDIIVLNGLPRHAGQAEDVSRILAIQGVVSLTCTPRCVLKRIELNSGGDRIGRDDDSLEDIRKKLVLYQEKSAPLIKYYKTRNIPIGVVSVDVPTQPEDIVQGINTAF